MTTKILWLSIQINYCY